MRSVYILLVPAALVLAGCRDVTAPPPAVYPVQGKVVFGNGTPVSSGRVTFHPKDLAVGQETFAELERNGTFKLDGASGVRPGEYVVTVDPVSYKTGRPTQNKRQAIPPTYQSPTSSTWTCSISTGDNNLPPFEIR